MLCGILLSSFYYRSRLFDEIRMERGDNCDLLYIDWMGKSFVSEDHCIHREVLTTIYLKNDGGLTSKIN